MLGFGLWVICFYTYLSYLPATYTYDGMVFASKIESAHVPLRYIFPPHHLLYNFLGRCLYFWGRENGASWDGLVALQFFDILTGVLGVILTFHLLVRKTNDRLVSFLSAAGLSFTFSYWYFSTSPGVRIFATVTPLFVWYLLTYLERETPPVFGLVLGFAHALAVLGHQTNLLLTPAFIGGICLSDKKTLEKLKTLGYYLFALTTGALGPYLFVGRYVWQKETYEKWLWWFFAYLHVKQWGGNFQPAGFEAGKAAMVQAFLSRSHPDETLAASLTFGSVKMLFQCTVLVLLGLFLLRIKWLWKEHPRSCFVGLFWLLAFVPFFVWWEPWNIEFWVASTVPCWILMSIVVADISDRWKNPILRFANRSLVLGLWGSLIVLLFMFNFQNPVKKNAVIHSPKEILEALDWKARVDDLVILTGINTVPFYIDRYQKRDYLSLDLFFKKYEKPEGDKTEIKRKKDLVPPKPDPWADLSQIFTKVWRRHRKVWVLTEAADENESWNLKFENLLNIPRGQTSSFFHQYQLHPIAYHHQVFFYEVVKPVPTSTPVAEITPGSVPTSFIGKKEKKKGKSP